MILLKKLIFAPIFLIVFGLLIYQLIPLLANYDFIFSLSSNTFIQLASITAALSLSSFLFVLFATIASDWKIFLPVGAVASAIPMVLMDQSLGLVFSVELLVSIILTSLTLDSTLKNYLNFQPSAILGPSIKRLSMLLLLAFCVIYFLSSNKFITQKGFQIPDSLIDTALKFAAPTTSNITQEQSSLPQLTPEQFNLLKSNPDALKQFGLDPSILDSLTNPQKTTQPEESLTNTLIKQTIKDQVQNIIKPYIGFVPAGLAILLFLTLQFFTSLTNLLIYPLLWLIFLILEKTGFTRYEVETRQVKKLVV